MTKVKNIIGWREWISFPELGLHMVKAKIDTGARSSALHATNIRTYVSNSGRHYVKFLVQSQQRNRKEVLLECVADIVDLRVVRSSSGHEEKRVTISTNLTLGVYSRPIEITLTNREQMGFQVLIGRTALVGKYVVDPQKSFVAEKIEK